MLVKNKKYIPREKYLNHLIARKHNGLIKIITGIRRCGKSYLLNTIFYQHLLESGIDESHIIRFAFDSSFDLDKIGEDYLDPEVMKHGVNPRKFTDYLLSQLKDSKQYYLILDEVQNLRGFETVLNGLIRKENLDIYVTGSNSRFLSTDVITEFAGRGDEVHILPLSFSEFFSVYTDTGNVEAAWDDYLIYGGLPAVALMEDIELKIQYLKTQVTMVYLRDIKLRYHIQQEEDLQNLVRILASTSASPTNPTKLTHTFASVMHTSLSAPTIDRYISYLQDAFMVKKSQRYDVRGKHYLNSPFKLYFEDTGIRNAILDFRQNEATALMEHAIFNELRYRGFSVDVGIVIVHERNADNRQTEKRLEVDFIANKGSKRYYIQSVCDMPTEDKRRQEYHSFESIHDSFKKIIIVDKIMKPSRDEKGYVTMGITDFLLNPESLDA